MSRRIISLVLSFGLLFQQVSFAQVAAELNIANYLSRVGSNIVQDKFRPLHLRYFSYDSLNDNFKILLDKGDLKNLKAPELENSTKTLLGYFLVGVTLPDDMFWVNLRPDSEDQIIDPYLEKTDVGKIMLEADLQLKKDTAAMTSPATPEGKEYWDKLYKKAAELYGYDNVTIPTLTRPWIVPGEIIVRESKDSAYVYKATLKVMLEQDYLKDSATYNFKDERSKALNEYSSQLIRELIIPKLTKEVNSSKRYAALRQVYYSLILSRWFKLRFTGKTGTYASLINTRNLTNLTSQELWTKTTYFKQYQKSFKDGEYNIKEPVYTPTGQVIRSYFSGGINVASSAINTQNGVILANDNANRLGEIIISKAIADPWSVNLHTISQSNSNGSTRTSSPITFAMIKDECDWRMAETERKFTEGPPNRDVFRYDFSKVKRKKVGRLVKMLNIGRGAKPPNTIKVEELQTVVEFGKGRNYLWDRPTTPIFGDVNIGGIFTDITINPFPFFREHILLMPERLKEIVAKTDFSSIPGIDMNALWQRLIDGRYIERMYVIGDSFKKIKSPSEMDLGAYNNRKEEIYNVFQIYFDDKLRKKFVEQTDFLSLGIDINALWQILIAKGYLYEKGRVQDSFKRMESSLEMDLGHDYNNRRKEQVYQILRQRLNGEHNQVFRQQAATVAFEHLRNMNRASYKVAFNSLAAFGSFNQLHLQAFDYTEPGPNGQPYGNPAIMPVEEEFEKEYRENSLIPVPSQRNGVTVSVLSNWMVKTLVFSSQNAAALQTELLRLTDVLYAMNQPFNILFTYNPSEGMYKAYVYPRKPETASKFGTGVAYLELSGEVLFVKQIAHDGTSDEAKSKEVYEKATEGDLEREIAAVGIDQEKFDNILLQFQKATASSAVGLLSGVGSNGLRKSETIDRLAGFWYEFPAWQKIYDVLWKEVGADADLYREYRKRTIRVRDDIDNKGTKDKGRFIVQYLPYSPDINKYESPLTPEKAGVLEVDRRYSTAFKRNVKGQLWESLLAEEQINGVSIRPFDAPKPYGAGHIVLVPRMKDNLDQVLIEDAIKVALKLINDSVYEEQLKIGFNGIEAYASVRQLHLQALFFEDENNKAARMSVETFATKDPIYENNGVTISELDGYPAAGFVFESREIAALTTTLYDAVSLLQNTPFDGLAFTPHNLIFTKTKNGSMRVFVFPRKKELSFVEKTKTDYEIGAAFVELAGVLQVTKKEEISITVKTLEQLPSGLEFPISLKLSDIPTDLDFPLKGKIYYDSKEKILVFKGVMSNEERNTLLKLSNDTLYQKAIEKIFQSFDIFERIKAAGVDEVTTQELKRIGLDSGDFENLKRLMLLGISSSSSSVTPESRVSSPAQSIPDKKTGGIDFRVLPMTIQPMGSFSGLNFKLPQLSQAELGRINVDEEMQQIKNMVQARITPSGQRIKEFIAACVQKGEINSQIDNLLLCLAGIFKLEEENASESSPELREALVIVDSQG